MTCKTQIDDMAMIFDRLFEKWLQKQTEIRELGHTPDNIVTQTNAVQFSIQLRDTASDFRFHGISS